MHYSIKKSVFAVLSLSLAAFLACDRGGKKEAVAEPAPRDAPVEAPVDSVKIESAEISNLMEQILKAAALEQTAENATGAVKLNAPEGAGGAEVAGEGKEGYSRYACSRCLCTAYASKGVGITDCRYCGHPKSWHY